MIKPTIGRVVLVHRFDTTLNPVSDQPEPALVSYVHSDTLINVGGFSANGHPFALTSLRLVQEGDDLPAKGDSYATWMPYQIEAAKKAEAETAEDPTEVAGDEEPAEEPTV